MPNSNQQSLTNSGTHGERKSGVVHGATDQSNGRRSGWRSWGIGLEMMGYDSIAYLLFLSTDIPVLGLLDLIQRPP